MLTKVRNLFSSEPAPGDRAGAALALAPALPGVLRHSNGLREFLNGWDKLANRRLLDLGCTSSANVAWFTECGHSLYSDDLLLDIARPNYQLATDAGPRFDAARWLEDNLTFGPERFDAVLLWDLVDYIPETLVKPLFERLAFILRPAGSVLAYFHTKDAGADTPFFRYHIHDRETLELRPDRPHRLQRVFNNRHVENLFHGYRSIKFFLARDNLREVVASK